jgi:hypothetical protein
VLSEAEEAGNQELESVKRPRLSQTDLGLVFAVQVVNNLYMLLIYYSIFLKIRSKLIPSKVTLSGF